MGTPTDFSFWAGNDWGNPHAFRFAVFPERYRLGLDRLVNGTILKKLASISPKWDLTTETAQIGRLPQVLQATKV